MTGAEGNDVIVGSGGTDQLVGGIGDDTYVPSSVDQTLAENADEGSTLCRSQTSVNP